MVKYLVVGSLILSYSSILLAQSIVDTNLTNNYNFKSKPILKQDIVRQELKDINTLATNKQLKKALPLAKKLYINNPTRKDVAQNYAKLLFWDGQVDSAYSVLKSSGDSSSKLYKQIYISKALKNINSFKSSTKKIKTIDKLESFAQKDYEILWTKMQAYIKLHQFYNALKVAKKLHRLYPKSIEAHESMARLYFWTKRYKSSLNTYYALRKKTNKSYAKEIRKVKNAIAIRNKPKVIPTKEKELDTKFAVNDKFKYKAIPLSVENEKKAHMVGIGYDYFEFSDKRYTDNTKYIEATIPVWDFVLYNRVDDTHRYGLHDTQYYAELYPTMPKPWWGYLSLSFTPSADFYSKYSIGWHQYYDIGNWEFGLGYNYAKYSDIHTNTLIALYTYYFNDNLYFTQTGYYVTSNKSWSVSNRLDYKVAPHHKYYISYIKSDSYENDDQISIILRNNIKSDKFLIGCEVPVYMNYHLGLDASYEDFDAKNNNYSRKELNTYFRYYW